jgi:uncharacterized protein (PEP-CTERM system associated)
MPNLRSTDGRSLKTPAALQTSCVALFSALLSCAAHAQSARYLAIDPTLDVQAVHSDGRRTDGGAGSEFTGELRPGIRISGRSGYAQGSLSYGLGLVHRSRANRAVEAQHRLSAALTGQLIEDRVFIDVGADVSRQPLSSYGVQSAPGSLAENANWQDVATLRVSPVLRGVMLGQVNYSLRLNASATNTRRSAAGDSTTKGGAFSLSSAISGSRFGWAVNADSTITDYRVTGNAINESATASLTFTPESEVTFSLRGGAESTNFGELDGKRNSERWGAAVRWSPSPSTQANLTADRRFFGSAHSINVSYRRPRSNVTFSSTRDVNLGGQRQGSASSRTLYDQFFEQFAAQEPDPGLRQTLVLSFLAGQGLDPNATVGAAGSLSGPVLQQRKDLAVSYNMRRLTLAIQAFANDSSQLSAGGQSASITNATRQRGYSGSAAWRLTPTASVNLLGSRLMTQPNAQLPGNDLKSLSLNLVERLGPRTTATLGAGRTVFNSVVNPYRETAASASLGLRF